MIDFKGGKVTWDNSYNWTKDNYDYEQDILQVKYGENLIIDVGNYGKGESFTIMVIDFTPYSKDDDKPLAWEYPFALIPCKDRADMLIQLQRAIDIYPMMIGGA